MKILYGVQGTGNGHIARARVMAEALSKRSEIEVDFVFTGRPPEKYFDMHVFGHYRTFKGLTFVTENGCVNRFKTLKQLDIRQLFKDVSGLNLGQYDLLLNDFEPVTAWAAKLKQLTSLSVSHQAAFKYPIPKQGESFHDRLVMRIFAPCNINLGVHWYHFGYPIMPPFIDESATFVTQGKKVLVYLPFENTSSIKHMLHALPSTEFVCYHPDIQVQHQELNILWCRLSKSEFQRDLYDCIGVIANGGFELSSECLQLGKKALIKPLKNQFEQSSNRLTLEYMACCSSMSSLDPNAVQDWLRLPSPMPIHYPNNANLFIDWLLQENWQDTTQLCDLLWQSVRFPTTVEKSLSTRLSATL